MKRVRPDGPGERGEAAAVGHVELQGPGPATLRLGGVALVGDDDIDAGFGQVQRRAEQLGLAKGHVSTSVRQLEERVGTRLLQRTTRSVRLTQDGERFLERCKEFLAEAEQLQAMFQPAASGLSGCLRIDRHLGVMQTRNVASPAYLSAHGVPRTLADLAGHRVVHYTPRLTSNDAGWEYFDATAGSYKILPMTAAVTVNGTDAYQAAALAGLGFIQAPTLGLRGLLAEGLLVPVMPDFTACPMPVSLLYANRRQLAPRVQAVMNWLSGLITPYLIEAT